MSEFEDVSEFGEQLRDRAVTPAPVDAVGDAEPAIAESVDASVSGDAGHSDAPVAGEVERADAPASDLDAAPGAVPPGNRSVTPVTAAMRELETLTDLELAEHPEVYQRIHAELQAALATIDNA